jgi:hypothetical protein
MKVSLREIGCNDMDQTEIHMVAVWLRAERSGIGLESLNCITQCIEFLMAGFASSLLNMLVACLSIHQLNALRTGIFFLYIYHKSLIQSRVTFFLNPARRTKLKNAPSIV